MDLWAVLCRILDCQARLDQVQHRLTNVEAALGVPDRPAGPGPGPSGRGVRTRAGLVHNASVLQYPAPVCQELPQVRQTRGHLCLPRHQLQESRMVQANSTQLCHVQLVIRMGEAIDKSRMQLLEALEQRLVLLQMRSRGSVQHVASGSSVEEHRCQHDGSHDAKYHGGHPANAALGRKQRRIESGSPDEWRVIPFNGRQRPLGILYVLARLCARGRHLKQGGRSTISSNGSRSN
mmetsp:Transcript_77250/g.226550  ORF Transcript_77250/g.226550 Transcript_77250/m.226550 type:complete len:235 (+) Transcript_77250:740-1444(+)